MQIPPPLPNSRPPDWWARNWKWSVPLLAIAGVLLIGGFVMSIFGFIRSSEAYVGAVVRAKAAPAVIEALGTPIEERFFVTGTVEVNGTSGKADLVIPLVGPKGTATIYVAAGKAQGVWHYHGLMVRIERTGEKIDLSEKQADKSAGAAADEIVH